MPAQPSASPGAVREMLGSGRWFMLSLLVGVVAGCGAIAFHWANSTVAHYTLREYAGYTAPQPAGEYERFPLSDRPFSPWWLLGLVTAGGLASGLLVYSIAPEAEGHGTDAVIEAFHQKEGFIRARIPLVKLVASAITIGTGGSAGREGPIAQIGAGFGSLLGTWLKLSAHDRRILLAAGMGAGIGSIFRAPLAGALFAAEILYRDADIESEVLVPAALSSAVAFLVFSFSLPVEQRFEPLFGTDLRFVFHNAWELLPLALLAGVLTVASYVYVHTFYGMVALFKRLPGPPHVRPALGALLAGLAGLGLYWLMDQNPQALGVLSSGYGALQLALTTPEALGLGLLLAIALVKILTTSLTIGSGGSGGVFGPSIVIGGCLSGAFAQALSRYWPQAIHQPEIYPIVGMAGFFACCAHAPVSTVLMVSEITGDYQLLLPTMWVATLCFMLNRRWTLYIKQVPTRRDTPAHQHDLPVEG